MPKQKKKPSRAKPIIRLNKTKAAANCVTRAEQSIIEYDRRFSKILEEIRREVDRASSIHAPMHSAWEGYAVILEELEELWDEVKAYKGRTHPSSPEVMVRMRKEAIQLGAMAVRFVDDVCDKRP